MSRRQPTGALEFPAAEIAFGSDGAAIEPGEMARIRSELAGAGVTDLLIMCGGWCDHDAGLRTLYDGLTASVKHAVGRDAAYAAHTYGILRVMWPVRRWPEQSIRPAPGDSTPEERIHRNVAALEMEVTSLRGTLTGRQADRHLLKVWQLICSAIESVPAQVSLVEHVRELVRGTDELDPAPKPDEYALRRFLAIHPIRLLEAVSEATTPDSARQPPRPIGGDSDDADGLAILPTETARCDVFQGIRNLLRYAVANEMRVRAEAVGRIGLREALLGLSRGLPQTHFHLIGHSFGARAVLTAVDAPSDSGRLLRPKTISILQGVLPETAFAPGRDDHPEGIFHSVLAEGKAGGPILVTHSASDETAGIPYAIAKCIADYSQPGKHDYPYPAGPMALNGASDIGALQLSLSGRSRPRWKRGMVANLDGDGLIGNHTDVCKPEIAEAILSAATTTT